MKKEKILGIGLPRTGTTSLAAALEILGYKVLQFCPITNTSTKRELFKSICGNFGQYDAIVTSWLDATMVDLWAENFKDHRFIYCLREGNSRAASLNNIGEQATVDELDQEYIYVRLMKSRLNSFLINCAWDDVKKWSAVCKAARVDPMEVNGIKYPHVNQSQINYII